MWLRVRPGALTPSHEEMHQREMSTTIGLVHSPCLTGEFLGGTLRLPMTEYLPHHIRQVAHTAHRLQSAECTLIQEQRVRALCEVLTAYPAGPFTPFIGSVSSSCLSHDVAIVWYLQLTQYSSRHNERSPQVLGGCARRCVRPFPM